MPPALTLISDYREAFIFTNPFRHHGSRGIQTLNISPPGTPGHPAPRKQRLSWGFGSAWLAQGCREGLWCSKTKDVRLQQALMHSEGGLSHSDKALQSRQSHWAKQLFDPSQKYPVFSSAFGFFTHIFSCTSETNVIWSLCKEAIK